jgi:type I restriction enzyme S subunit
VSVEQLITEHLDIWTAADTEKKSGRGRSSGSTGSVYGVKKLRELILELAVRGKLVSQHESDQPASELLKKIAVEKTKLVAEGKIKKSKPLAEITDDEKPFELPTTWKWLRLPDIYYSLSVSKNKLLSSEIKENGLYPVVDQGQRFIAGYTDNDGLLIYLPGPVVVFGDHTTERKLIDFDFVAGADGVKILRPILQSERFFWLQLKGLKIEERGYARHFKILNECFYALPPINEQHRIVTKVDELMALCDQLENQHNNAAEAHEKLVAHLLGTLTQSQNAEDFNANWQRIAEHFDTLFTTETSIDELKQTLLQLAVMGKLVPQDPNDEPASELLKRIQAEKAELIAEGKIKKEKPLASITEEEKPFDLPVGWEWVHLFKIADVISGNAFKSEDFNNESGTRVIKITNTGVNELIETSDFLPESFRTKYENYIVNEGDLLLALTRPYISNGLKISKCPSSYNKSLLNQRVAAIKINNHTNEEYVYQTLKSPYVLKTYQHRFGGSGLQPNLKISDVTELLIPLSPLAEQHRIVSKVDELMAICDQLKTRINEANELQRKIADVVVENTI